MNKHNKDKQRKIEKRKNEYIKRRTFQNIVFSSIFEREVAEYLSSCKINWIRNEERFPIEMDGVLHYYVPDFFLPEYELYLECKGIWFSTSKKRKTLTCVAKYNMPWVLLMQTEWRQSKHILINRIKSYEFNS